MKHSRLPFHSLIACLFALSGFLKAENTQEFFLEAVFSVSKQGFVPQTKEYVARCLCSQLGGAMKDFTNDHLLEELGAILAFNRAEKDKPDISQSLLIIEYSRQCAFFSLDRQNEAEGAAKALTPAIFNVCESLVGEIPQHRLDKLAAWQKSKEVKVRIEYNKAHGRHPDEYVFPPSAYPYGSQAVLLDEVDWDDQKWKDFVVLRAHELAESLRAKNVERTMHLLAKSDANVFFPAALEKMTNYLRSKKETSPVAQVLYQYQERNQRILRAASEALKDWHND